jgi:anti-sigma factor RsiW
MLPYVDGKLSDRECAAVGAHLQRCPTCAGELAAVKRLCEVLDRDVARDVPGRVPSGLENATMRRIRAAEIAVPDDGAPRLRWVLPWATALAAAGLALYLTGGRDRTHPGAMRSEHELTAVTPEAPLAGVPPDHVPTQLAAKARRASAGGAMKGEASVEDGRAADGSSTDDVPVELRNTPGLFVDFPIIDELDKFEHYDSIWSVTNEHAGRPRGG